MNRLIARFCALALAGTLFLTLPAGPTLAQTATDLDCRGCVGGRDIGKNAVTGKKIRKNAVAASRLAPNAKPAGVSFQAKDGDGVVLSQADQVIASAEVHAPGNGFVIAIMSGYLGFGGPNLVGCDLTQGTAFNNDTGVIAQGTNTNETMTSPISHTRVFPVTKGTSTINLVCLTDGAQPVAIANPQVTALFVPAAY